MSIFDFFKKNKKKDSLTQTMTSYSLDGWWFSEFSKEERKYISEVFKPLIISSDSDEIIPENESEVEFLTNLAGWFNRKDKDLLISQKILKKSELLLHETKELSSNKSNINNLTEINKIMDEHFLYGEKISSYYKNRNKLGYLEKAIDSCNQQIQFATKAASAFKDEYKNEPLPHHQGFKQLAIIFEKQKKFSEAIKLCVEADKQGWGGDWQKRIQRCNKRIKGSNNLKNTE